MLFKRIRRVRGTHRVFRVRFEVEREGHDDQALLFHLRRPLKEGVHDIIDATPHRSPRVIRAPARLRETRGLVGRPVTVGLNHVCH